MSGRAWGTRSSGLAVVTVMMLSTVVLGVGPAAADERDVCAALQAPISQRTTSADRAALLTGDPSAAQMDAYPVDRGPLFKAGITPADGLTSVRYLSKGSDNFFVAGGPEAANAVSSYDYRDNGVSFYVSAVSAVSAVALSCTVPVYRYRDGGIHRQAVTAADRAALTSAGWVAEGISFYAVPVGSAAPTPTTDTRFSIAVEPDTQGETNDPDDPRFRQRNQWLADNAGADELDLRFVTHTGDVVNWDTADHAQYEVASAAMVPLERAGIPFSLGIGNHDSMATGGGNGGSARDPKHTSTLMRDTRTFNSYFTATRFAAVSGTFEPGKVDNSFSEFAAGGARWLVLNLELWPRVAAVNWARDVVRTHPGSNVIVVTHSYLESDGSISQSKSYGATSPQYLFDNLISRYANIKLVFSGHTGVAAARTDTGVNGNKIRSFLTAIHSTTTNPVRILEIDTAADTLTSRIVAPFDASKAWRPYDLSLSGMRWITAG